MKTPSVIFSFFCSPLFSLALLLVFFAESSAQNGVNKFNLKSVGDDRTVSATERPRVIAANTKIESNSAARLGSTAIFDLERLAFQLINEKRAAQNLPPLKWNDDVAKIARLHSQNMAEFKFLSHTGTDGSMVDDRADRVGLSRWRAIGENIAYNRGYAQPVEFAVERWMLSPKHKTNLLSETWRESGIGIAVAPDGTYYLTQVFLLRK